GLTAGGLTNIGGGLQAGLGQIPTGGTTSRANTIVLLSDGDHNVGTDPNAVLPALRAAGITVLAIGVGNDLSAAGEATLQTIARETGGSYVRVRDNTFGLLGEYFRYYTLSTGSEPVARSPIRAADGKSSYDYATPVEPGATRADFLLALNRDFFNLEVFYDVRLTSPSGVTYFSSTNAADATFLIDGNLSGFRILNPEPGNWVLTAFPRGYDNDDLPPGVQPSDGIRRLQFQGMVEHPGTGLAVAVVKDAAVFPTPMTVTAVPYYRGRPVLGAEVSGFVTRPDASGVAVTLFDDGDPAHGDAVAGDGTYSARFNNYSANGNGSYQFDLTAVADATDVTADGEAALFPEAPSNSSPVPAFTRSGSGNAIITGVPRTLPDPVNLDVRVVLPTGDVRDGKQTTIRIVVTSTGTTDATDVRVDYELPGGILVITATTDKGTVTVTGGSIDAVIDLLGPGESATITVVVVPLVTGEIGTSATASSGGQVVGSLDTSVDTAVLIVRESSPAERLPDVTAVGIGFGRNGPVSLYNPDETVRATVDVFPGFTGGIRTATADFNRDGVPDFVAGTGPGRATQVVVYDGATRAVLFSIDPFEATFTGGVFVATGDLTGDGVPELLISPDEGGGPRVRVFDGTGFSQVADFFGIDDANFRGGARAGVGDVTGDGIGDLIVAAGFGGGPRVAGFDGTSRSGAAYTRRAFADFFAFEPALRNGVYVASGDLDGDGSAELIAGAGPGGGPRVTAFDGADLLTGKQTATSDFFAGDTSNRDGIRVVVKNLDNDAVADLVTGSGRGGRVTGYAGKTLATGAAPPAEVLSFDAFPDAPGGVFVG
ncbi:MAG TPA: VWA domain-containing protein, partial [Gemmataceae bacterium]|nr:VWA domain-containing protein [Gemmataceae bacterium]